MHISANILSTRMHSSRMRTVRCSGHRLGGCLPGRCLSGGVYPGGVCLGMSPQGVSAQGVSAWGCLPRWGVCPGTWLPRGCLLEGSIAACTGQGGCLPQCMLGYTPLWTEFLTHTCENITFPQLRLRTVTISLAPLW